MSFTYTFTSLFFKILSYLVKSNCKYVFLTQQPPPGAQYTIHIYHSSIKNQSILCSFDLTNFHIINKLWLNVCTGLFHWFNRIKFSYRSIITALPFIKYIIVAPQTLLSFDGNTFSTFATNHNTSDF